MEKKYDVFISCKSEDYGYAGEVYNFLNSNGIRTFLASKELRKMGDSEYRNAIVQALESAYHLIIFASKPEYVESKWVFYEWDTFVNAKLNGRIDGQIMTILKGVETNALRLDLIKYESFNFESYKDRLLHYVETPDSRRKKEEQKRQEESLRQQAAIEAQKRIEKERQARIREEEYNKALAEAHRKEERIRRNAEEKAKKEEESKTDERICVSTSYEKDVDSDHFSNSYDDELSEDWYKTHRRWIWIVGSVVLILLSIVYFQTCDNWTDSNLSPTDSIAQTDTLNLSSNDVTESETNKQKGKRDNSNLSNRTFYSKVALVQTDISIPDLPEETDQMGENKKNSLSTDDKKIYNVVEQMPTFPGGEAALLKYVNTHIKYPEVAIKNKIQGKVILRFVIEKDGTVNDVNVTNSLSKECDEEAIRVVKSLPRFIPGKQDGKTVRAYYTLPIRFMIQ